MNGEELLEAMRGRIQRTRKLKHVTDTALASHLGMTLQLLQHYMGQKKLTPRQVVRLMEKVEAAAEKRLTGSAILPIVEFLRLAPIRTKQGKTYQLFSVNDGAGKDHPYLQGIQDYLERAHGIFVFHDSSGRAIYAGKAEKQTLWKEMNNALNRDRGEVQNIKRVSHPKSHVKYKGREEPTRKIVKQAVALHDLATYMTAYEVPSELIGKLEALIVRSFANDLLNVRMESLVRQRKPRKLSRRTQRLTKLHFG